MIQCALRHCRTTAAWATVLLFCGWAAPAADPVEPAPLARDGEFLEVTAQNTLRHRYHSNDFNEEMAFYLERAKQHAKGRTPGKMKIQQVLIREIDIMTPGGKHAATCKIPDSFIEEAAEYEKTFADFVYGASDGAVVVEWLPTRIIDKVQYDNQGELGGNWWLAPKRLEGQLDFLKEMKAGDIDFMFFYLHTAARTDNPGSVLWPEFGGMAWGGEEIQGARLLTLNDHELARSVHELKHHIFDTTIRETEGITVTRPHGLIDAGYEWSALGWGAKIGSLNLGPCMAYYRDCYRYYYPRDMWERWRLRPAHNIQHEPFAGQAYVWADVKSDYWFKLPQLRTQELRKLTGLKNIQTFAPDAALVFQSGQANDPFYGGATPQMSGDAKSDNRLNHTLSLANESCAYIEGPTGRWLFVKPQAADFFVDLLKLRGGKRGKPLAVYGYVLEGFKAALAMRLPDDFPALTDEIGLFRPLPVIVETKGLVSPDDYRFTKSASVTLKTSLKGAGIRYTLDHSDPTAASPLIDSPITLSDTTTIKARLFGKDVPAGLATWRKTYEYRPFKAKVEGLAEDSGTSFKKQATIRFTTDETGGTIRYRLDGQAPAADSPAFSEPIVVKESTSITARYFDAANQPHGYTWSARFDENNLAMGKPVTASGNINPDEKPEFAVDGYVDGAKYWGTIPAPQWLQVDLEKEYKIDRIHLFPYWDGNRHYQYKIEASTDGTTWTCVVDASANTQTETDRGRLHTFDPTPARYVKLTMLKNSDNPAVHVVEMRVFEAGEK